MLVATTTTTDEKGLPGVIPSGARDLGKRGVPPDTRSLAAAAGSA
jgi:hypothetical protein